MKSRQWIDLPATLSPRRPGGAGRNLHCVRKTLAKVKLLTEMIRVRGLIDQMDPLLKALFSWCLFVFFTFTLFAEAQPN